MGILLNPELESRIAAKVQSGRYSSADEVVEQGLELLEARDGADSPRGPMDGAQIAKWILELAKSIPEEELSKLPTDLASNVDHYLYGAPRQSE